MNLALVLVGVSAFAQTDTATKPQRLPEPTPVVGIERIVRELLAPDGDPGNWCKTPSALGDVVGPVVVPIAAPKPKPELSTPKSPPAARR